MVGSFHSGQVAHGPTSACIIYVSLFLHGRLYALQEDSGVQKPCVIRPYQTAGCSSIEVEIWELPLENVGEFVAMIPPPLGIGTIGLDDGSVVKGFIAEAWVADAAKAGDHRVREITQHGGWLNYLESVV